MQAASVACALSLVVCASHAASKKTRCERRIDEWRHAQGHGRAPQTNTRAQDAGVTQCTPAAHPPGRESAVRADSRAVNGRTGKEIVQGRR